MFVEPKGRQNSVVWFPEQSHQVSLLNTTPEGLVWELFQSDICSCISWLLSHTVKLKSRSAPSDVFEKVETKPKRAPPFNKAE